jgi:hypothetical protein
VAPDRDAFLRIEDKKVAAARSIGLYYAVVVLA